MTRLMVLGAGRHQTPLIERARGRGIETIAVDYYPDSPGKRIADHAVLADALDVDAVRNAARQHGIDGITTVGTDQAMLVVAHVAHELGLPCHITPESALAATNKVHMRRALEAVGVGMTRGHLVRRDDDMSDLDRIELPCVVKATDSQGQRGMQRIERREALPGAIEIALAYSRTGTVIVEEFESGPELTINAWMANGEPVMLIAADRHTYNPSPAIGICLRHVVPSVFAAHHEMLREIAVGVAAGYAMTNGPLYIQTLATSDGFRVVEAASRVGGGHEAQLLDEMFGVDLLGASIDLALGRPPTQLPSTSNDEAGSVNFVVARPGVIDQLSDFATLVDRGLVARGQWYIEPGHEQGPIVDSLGRIGAFITVAGDAEDDAHRAAYASLVAADADGVNLVFWPDDAEMNVCSSPERVPLES